MLALGIILICVSIVLVAYGYDRWERSRPFDIE